MADIEIGQYRGYINEEHIKKDSLTETSAMLRAEINLPNLKGVPITLLTGKKLNEQSTDIIVRFKNLSNCLWENKAICGQNNELVFNIQPKRHIELKLNFGFDAAKNSALPLNLKFGFSANDSTAKDAYEYALLDVYNNDQSLFLDSKEISLSWKFIDPIMALIDKNREKILKIY